MLLLKSFSWGKISDYAIEFLLASVILFSPLIYASITILPLSILETLSLFLFFVFVVKRLSSEEFSFLKISLLPLAVFIPLITLQVVWLPEWFFSLFSPATFSLYRQFMPHPSSYGTVSIYPDATVFFLLQIISCIAVFFVAVNYLDNEVKCKRVIYVIIFSGFAYALYGIIMNIVKLQGGYSTFTNRNHFAAYIQLIIPLGLAAALTLKSRVKRVILFFASSVMIASLFYSWSRAGRICFVFGLIIFLVLLRIKRPFGKIIRYMVVLFIFLALLAGIIGFSGFFNRMESLYNPLKAYSDRFMFFLDTLRVVGDFPFLGVGLGAYPEIIQKYKTSDLQVSYVFSHNEPAQLLSETGVLGFIIISFFFVSIFYKSLRAWLKRMNTFSVFMSIGCFIGIASVLFHSLLDFVFHVPANLVLFFIIIALGFRVSHMSTSQQLIIPEFKFRASLWGRIFYAGFLCVFFVFIESAVISRCRAQLIFENVDKMEFAGSNLNLVLGYRRAVKSINKAISLNPLNSSYLNKKGDLFADLASREGIEKELAALEDFGSREMLLLSARRAYEAAVGINPTRADYHLRLGWAYNVLGRADLMRQQFDKAVLLDPRNNDLKEYIEGFMNDEKNI